MIIYTIGYGNRKSKDFISLLKKHGINIVVDVRRFPVSKYPGFAKEELEKALLKHGIRVYVHGRHTRRIQGTIQTIYNKRTL